MKFTQAIASDFKNCVNFSGRASRSEYWYWWLFSILTITAAGIVDEAFMKVPIGAPYTAQIFGQSYVAIQPPIVFYIRLFIVSVVFLAILVPGISVAIRRLHDLNHRGWWLLVYFLPYLGAVIMFFWLTDEGTQGNNRFGADPLPVSDAPQRPKQRWKRIVLFTLLLLIVIPLEMLVSSVSGK